MHIRTIRYDDGAKQYTLRFQKTPTRSAIHARLYTYPRRRNPLLIRTLGGPAEITRSNAAQLLTWWRAQSRGS